MEKQIMVPELKTYPNRYDHGCGLGVTGKMISMEHASCSELDCGLADVRYEDGSSLDEAGLARFKKHALAKFREHCKPASYVAGLVTTEEYNEWRAWHRSMFVR